MTTSSSKQGQHIMFSYGWDIQKDVLEIYHRLQARNIPVWMDIQGGMKDYLTVSMSEAIENAAAICCFITSKYQSSPYCKKELLYAQDCQKPLIPCLMDVDSAWKPTEWLGYAIIDIMYIDVRDLLTNKTPENFEAKCELLIKRINRTIDPSLLGNVQHVPQPQILTTPELKEEKPEGFQTYSRSRSSSTSPTREIEPTPEQNSDENSCSNFDRYLPHPSHFA